MTSRHKSSLASPLPQPVSGLGLRCPATRHYTVISPARGWRQNTMNCVSEPPADQLQLGPGHTLKYHHRPPAQSSTGGRKLLFNSLCEGTNDFWKANLANCCFQNQLELLSFRFMVLNWNIFSGLSALQVDFFLQIMAGYFPLTVWYPHWNISQVTRMLFFGSCEWQLYQILQSDPKLTSCDIILSLRYLFFFTVDKSFCLQLYATKKWCKRVSEV